MRSYLDLDTIMSEEERIPCRFLNENHRDGFMDPQSESDIDELPFWLAQQFSNSIVNNQVLIEANLPKHYGQKMRNEIKAGAKTINFKEYSLYYFETGVLLANLLRDEQLLDSFRSAFAGQRYLDLVARALSNWEDTSEDFSTNSEYYKSLINAELVLFTAGSLDGQDLMRWKRGDTSLLRGASILTKHTSGTGNIDGSSSSGSSSSNNIRKRGRN